MPPVWFTVVKRGENPDLSAPPMAKAQHTVLEKRLEWLDLAFSFCCGIFVEEPISQLLNMEDTIIPSLVSLSAPCNNSDFFASG